MPKKDKKSSSGAPLYPVQQQPAVAMQPMPQSYPMNPMQNPAPYGSAPPAHPYYNAPNGPMPGMPAPPPSYDQAMHHPVAPPHYVPQPMHQQVPVYNYPVHYQQQHHAHTTYVQPIPPQTTFVVRNAFDAGARFDSTSQPRIPPPPPGVAPNLAQIASSNGHDVVAGQRSDNWVMGGSSGGSVFW